MDVRIGAPKYDQGTEQVALMLQAPLASLSQRLSQDYGGEIEHLWIDLELSPLDADLRSHWKFRYQKTVAPSALLRGLKLPKHHHVGHFSVRPNYYELAQVPLSEVVGYLLSLIYESTAVLVQRQKQLAGFDADEFRSEFRAACRDLGYGVVEALETKAYA